MPPVVELDPVAFEIVANEHGVHASNGNVTVTVPDEGGKIFRRRAVKNAGTELARRVEWAVAELDGVRAYVADGSVILTRKDLWP